MKRLVGVVVALLLSAACTSTGHVTNQSRLVLAYRSEPTTLDPLLLGGRQNEDVTALLYSTLLHEDSNGIFTPEVASVVPTQANGGISRDGLELRFQLRRDVRWSDGAKLTADDVAYTIAAMLNPANNIDLPVEYDAIKSAAVMSRYSVVVRLKKRYAPILESLNVAILPQHILRNDRSLNNQPFDSHPIGSGPYELKKWLRNDRIELVANPYYYHGRAAIPEIDLESIPNDATALALLRAGTIDGSFGIDSTILPELRALPNYRILDGSPSYIKALTFNVRDPILRDIAVRRAFAAAIDLPSTVGRVTRGAFDARDAAMPAFRWSYDPGARYSQYDVHRAAAILDAAGWHRDSDGRRDRDGRPLSVEMAYMTGQPSNEQMATQMQVQLAAAGIDVTLHGFSTSQFYADGPVGDSHSQVIYLSVIQPPDPDQSIFVNCDQMTPRGANHMFYCNKAVDALNRAAIDTYDRSKRAVLYRKVQHILARDLPFIPVFAGRDFSVVAKRLIVPDLHLEIDAFQRVAEWRFR